MVIQQMFQKAMQGRNIFLDDIKLEKLSVKNTIDFFDRLVKEGLEDPWHINDILRITLRKSKEKQTEEDHDKDDKNDKNKEDDEKEVAQEHLTGISQAILEGKNLRENQFVHLAEKSGYFFSSMTYQFVNNTENSIINLRAEFKGSPKIFEVSLEHYSNISEESVTTIPDELNYSFRAMFWNSAKRIYEELVNGNKS